jgi:hypothetical protein
MSAGNWLQVIGGFLELLGLGFVALGITETRRRFTDRPSLVSRAVAPVRRLWARVFRRGSSVNLEVQSAGHTSTSGSLRLMQTVAWDKLTDQEAVERLKEIANRHEEEIDRLAGEIEQERRERQEQDGLLRSALTTLQQDFDSKIRLAAAGGLTLETWGAGLLAVGIILTIAGVWIG